MQSLFVNRVRRHRLPGRRGSCRTFAGSCIRRSAPLAAGERRFHFVRWLDGRSFAVTATWLFARMARLAADPIQMMAARDGVDALMRR
jgi:hypothetical protein